MNGNIENDFKNCHTPEDFENFVLKYNHLGDNDFVKQAKEKIREGRLKDKDSHDSRMNGWKYLLFALGCFVASVLLFLMGFSQEGQSASNTYHASFGDVKYGNPLVLLGIVGIVGGMATAAGGFWFLFCSIKCFKNSAK